MLQLETLQNRRPVSQGVAPRTVGLGFVLLLHTVAIYAFLTAIDAVPLPTIPTDISVRFIPLDEEPRPLPPPPPLPPPQVLPPVDVPPPVPFIDLTPPQAGNPITVAPPVVTESVPLEPAPPVAITPAQSIDGTHTIPDYPLISRRLGEQGAVRLELTIGDDGMVKRARILQSSGYRRLDDAAVDWVTRHWRYRPAMRGAMPVESVTETLMQFRLN